ncbi:MAG: HNH endonuclease [Sedimentisphaerales bacterium]|nr:HNH endonuclease [Sedimentisphaerales bacterium]
MFNLTKIDISFSLPVPAVFVRIGVWIVLLYRRIHYGYAFRRIKLTKGKYAIVDPEDFGWLSEYKWHCTNYGYAARKIPRKLRKGSEQSIMMHRELCPVDDDLFVDHINRIRNDNRKSNLRPATRQQNNWNSKQNRKKSNTQYTGIHWNNNRKKWQVQLTVNGKQRGFGYYTDEIEAAKAYDKVAKKYRGEFAILNFND